MALLLVVLGLILWLVFGYFVLGLILLIVGLLLFFAWDGGYGYRTWGRGP